ncbi:MAG TPA: LD-carboxypeptidase [Candidatus Binataceae bacterium]|nr:LD-carboxypeptidase [Candidatus Binataceae bacterium]
MIYRNPIKPPALRPGGILGVTAPAAAVDPAHLERGVQLLRARGYRVKLAPHVLARSGVLAGTDAQRAGDLALMFADPEVEAIIAARGGYGAGRLLPLLDYAQIARTPKLFVGFSDHTFVLNALFARAALIGLHGPVAAKDPAAGLHEDSLTHLLAVMAGESRQFTLEGHALAGGVAEGPLVGGCLSIVVAMLATPYAPNFRDAILLLEDTGERGYRIDRMLVQLRQAGVLSAVAGIALGGFRAPGGEPAEQRRIDQFLREQTADLGIPVLAGLEVGHATANYALPIGARVRLDADARSLDVLEAAVC